MTETKLKRLREAITWLRDTFGWSYDKIGEIVGGDDSISGSTIRRWENGTSHPQVTNRHAVFMHCDLHYFLNASFDCAEDCLIWINRYHEGFEIRPIELIENGEIDEVIGELAALKSGAFF